MRKNGIAALALAGSISILVGGFHANAQDIQDRTIRWGHLNNTDHPVSKGVQKFIEIVAAKSGGKLKVREYPANQLGPEMQQQSALRAGTQEMQSPARARYSPRFTGSAASCALATPSNIDSAAATTQSPALNPMRCIAHSKPS